MTSSKSFLVNGKFVSLVCTQKRPFRRWPGLTWERVTAGVVPTTRPRRLWDPAGYCCWSETPPVTLQYQYIKRAHWTPTCCEKQIITLKQPTWASMLEGRRGRAGSVTCRAWNSALIMIGLIRIPLRESVPHMRAEPLLWSLHIRSALINSWNVIRRLLCTCVERCQADYLLRVRVAAAPTAAKVIHEETTKAWSCEEELWKENRKGRNS